ncbi:hypothetical protein D3C76_1701280 [compost metagenome]
MGVARGAAFTLTSNVDLNLLPRPSLEDTVIVAVPCSIGVISRLDPLSTTLATEDLDEATVYVNGSPSGSVT